MSREAGFGAKVVGDRNRKRRDLTALGAELALEKTASPEVRIGERFLNGRDDATTEVLAYKQSPRKPACRRCERQRLGSWLRYEVTD